MCVCVCVCVALGVANCFLVISSNIFLRKICVQAQDDDDNNDNDNNNNNNISKSLRQYLSNIPGKHEIKELQNTAIWALHTYLEER